jgi:hypothetical protein
VSGQRTEEERKPRLCGAYSDMAGLLLSRMESEEQKEISTPFKKWTKVELLFHFFPIFFHFVPDVFSRLTEYFPIEVGEICSFSRD